MQKLFCFAHTQTYAGPQDPDPLTYCTTPYPAVLGLRRKKISLSGTHSSGNVRHMLLLHVRTIVHLFQSSALCIPWRSPGFSPTKSPVVRTLRKLRRRAATIATGVLKCLQFCCSVARTHALSNSIQQLASCCFKLALEHEQKSVTSREESSEAQPPARPTHRRHSLLKTHISVKTVSSR